MVNEGKVMEEAKAKALQAALAQIEKQFGKGSIMKMDSAAAQDVQVVSTGSLGLDIALGVGGLPRGRVVEIYGPESSGKTTLTLSVIAQVQKMGGTAAFIDAENALDPQYAAKLGVKIDELLISQPDTGEQALEIADMLVRSGSVDVIVIDSVAALTPKAEIEGEMGEPQMGLQARLMSQALRKLTSNIKRTNTLVIFINQIRMKIGVMFGNPETTTGGNARKFYASCRLDIRRIGSIKRGDDGIGSETREKVAENKGERPVRGALAQRSRAPAQARRTPRARVRPRVAARGPAAAQAPVGRTLRGVARPLAVAQIRSGAYRARIACEGSGQGTRRPGVEGRTRDRGRARARGQIGRASCRERVEVSVGGV